MNKGLKIIIKLLAICIILYVMLFTIVKYHKNEFQVPVFMYHDVILDENFENKPDTISLSTFESQLAYLKENEYKTLTLDEFYNWKNNDLEIPEKSVLLTFDDGFYSFYYLVEPLLEKYDMHAVCFVVGAYTNETTPLYDANKYGTIGKDIINNHSKYIEFGSHSYDLHRLIDNQKAIEAVSYDTLNEDVRKMHDEYGFEYISYPFNTDTDSAMILLKDNGYKLAFRGESEKTTKSANNYQIPRIGIDNDIEVFKNMLETDYHNNRYGNGILRKVMITLERKLGKRLFK